MGFKRCIKRWAEKFINMVNGLDAASPQPAPIKAQPLPEVEPAIVMDNMLLSGKNVLITGAGKNIGRSAAIEMAKQGANIYFTDINQESCDQLIQVLNKYPVKAQFFLSDVSHPADSDALINTMRESEILIDILVNNVGIQNEITGLDSLDMDEWQRIFNTNLFGPVHLTRLVAQMMVDNNILDSIIFISSIHEQILFKRTSYSASKAAVGMVIRELALMLAPDGIRVNGIAPGWTIEDEEGRSLDHRSAPLFQRTINPRYIGRGAVYLASDYFSKFTTGSLITIDAGQSLHGYLAMYESP